MKALCKKCNLKFTPLFNNHICDGSESIVHGNESIFNGIEHKNLKKICNYKCPYCDTYYKSGYIFEK